MPAVVDLVATTHRQGPAQGCEPGRGRRRRRRDPGRRVEGRRQGRPAPRRHAAVARHRDEGQIFTKLIERNTTIPTKRSEVFTTAEDNQPSVEIHVLQGESDMAYRNKTLGKFQLVGIPPAPRGVPQVEVTFDIDANGIVNVSAKDLATGKEQRMTITGGTALSKDDIDTMVKEAESHAEEDRQRREEAETRNNADSLVFQTEKLLKEQADNVSGDERQKIEEKLKALKDALAGSDIEAVKRRHEAARLQPGVRAAAVPAGGAEPAAGRRAAGGTAGPGSASRRTVR